MDNLLALTQWASDSRSADHVVAFNSERCWTQAMLIHDVHQLYAQLQTLPGERWALCFDNSYHFLVALLATLHAGKTPVLPGHSREAQLREQQHYFSGVITDFEMQLDCPVITPQSLPRRPAQVLPPLRLPRV